MEQKTKGLGLVIVGFLIWGTLIPLSIAWLAFCFGSVIIGLLMLFFAPALLFAPLALSFSFGLGVILNGTEHLGASERNNKEKPSNHNQKNNIQENPITNIDSERARRAGVLQALKEGAPELKNQEENRVFNELKKYIKSYEHNKGHSPESVLIDNEVHRSLTTAGVLKRRESELGDTKLIPAVNIKNGLSWIALGGYPITDQLDEFDDELPF